MPEVSRFTLNCDLFIYSAGVNVCLDAIQNL